MMKKDLRDTLLAQRRAIAADLRLQYDCALAAHILSWWNRHPVQSVGVYWPICGEPDLHAAYMELARCGVQLALPVIVNPDAPLLFAKWMPGDPLVSGMMKVPIPAPPHILISPEALLVPCVGFNRQRIRLGYGGGFYDRTLAVVPRPLTIGVAYRCAMAAFVAAPHDIALDAIITEDAAFENDGLASALS